MNIRVQQALDGDDKVRASLKHSEMAALAESEAAIASVVGALRRKTAPDLAPAVIDRIRQTQPVAARDRRNPLAGFMDWLWSPRRVAIQLRPAYAFALAALLAGAGLITGAVLGRIPTAADAVSAASPQVFVQFRLDAPAAREVHLAGNFTDWKPAHSMKRTNSGVWTVVVPITPGVHNYAFIVDGQRWVADPAAPAVNDGFGGQNSQLAVLSPETPKAL